MRAKLDEQLRALLEHEPVARAGDDPEGVHQMRVAVRRIRAALKAEGAPAVGALQDELRWFGGVLGAVRDLDVQLDHLRGQAAEFEPDELAAVERLLLGLRASRRKARQRLLGALRGARYRALLESLAEATRAEVVPPEPGEAVNGKKRRAAGLVELIKKPYRKLAKAAGALDDDPPDDDLHALRIHGKRLRYAAELASPAGGKRVRQLIKAAKGLQDVLGTHQDAVIAEQQVRRLLTELGDVPDADVAFAAGRLVERVRGRRADCRARWRDELAKVDAHASKVLTS